MGASVGVVNERVVELSEWDSGLESSGVTCWSKMLVMGAGMAKRGRWLVPEVGWPLDIF
jgi:hypothetical protein